MKQIDELVEKTFSKKKTVKKPRNDDYAWCKISALLLGLNFKLSKVNKSNGDLDAIKAYFLEFKTDIELMKTMQRIKFKQKEFRVDYLT